MPLASQIELPERYRVERRIASGGMATVWEAEDLLLGRTVAVKVLGAQYAEDPGARARFQREARTAAQVSDQTNVVMIYDIGEYRDTAFIVMEYFAGGTVADRLKAARDTGQPIAPQTALDWLGEAAAGLDVAHAAGIVHRDVKPANLLLDAQGRLAVADFGIARLADDTQMTQTGQVLGTAAYISPEQALGQPATPASDRYALAVVAFELLTGSRPFAGGPPTAQALQHAREQPPRASQAAPELPPAIDAVFTRGLAKDPEQRPRTASELVAALGRALGLGETDTRPMPIVETTPPAEPLRSRDGAAPAVPLAPRDSPAPSPRSEQPAPAATSPRPAPSRTAAARPAAEAAARAAGSPPPPPPPGRIRRQTPRDPRDLRPWLPIGGAALLVAAVIALVFVLAGGNDPKQAADPRASTKSERKSSRTSTQPAAAGQSETQQTSSPQTSSGASPATLNARGKELNDNGQYAAAVEPLRASVAGFEAAGDTSLNYAYALYNLAVALNRSGNPAEAVPLLRERLKYNDQRPKVQAELDNALAKLGEAAPGNGKKAKKDKPKRDDG